MNFETKRINSAPDAIAPDGSEVRLLCGLNRGGMAVFTLPSKAVSKAIAHHTVEEVWYFISGHGRMWRRSGNHKETVDVGPDTLATLWDVAALAVDKRSSLTSPRRSCFNSIATSFIV